MAISKHWHTGDGSDRWSVAQVFAPLDDVFSKLARSHSYRNSKQSYSHNGFKVVDAGGSPLVLYTHDGSSCTFLECVYGHIDDAAIRRLTKTFRTDALSAGFEDNNGSFGYIHYRNGVVQEEYFQGLPECHELPMDRCNSKGWIADATTYKRFYTKRKLEIDIETTEFFERWESISNHLGVDIPYLCWTNWLDKTTIAVDESINGFAVVTAKLLHS